MLKNNAQQTGSRLFPQHIASISRTNNHLLTICGRINATKEMSQSSNLDGSSVAESTDLHQNAQTAKPRMSAATFLALSQIWRQLKQGVACFRSIAKLSRYLQEERASSPKRAFHPHVATMLAQNLLTYRQS